MCPTVLFTAAQKIRWRREWRSALVVRGLGRRVSYLPLARRLNFLWARNGTIQITDMKNGCFLVRFKNKLDYEMAAYGGPWLLGDTYLAIHRWYKGFNPWTSEIKSTLVWVQLPELPVEFINAEAVMQIAGLIGRPVRVDRATELGARAKFARVCVEVDLTRPLLSQYKVEGITYLIQYEGLQNICGECGLYGDGGKECRCMKKSREVHEEDVSMVPETQEQDQTNGRVYGDWMMVQRKPRKQAGRDGGKNAKVPEKFNNRFDVLHEVDEGHAFNVEVGKEKMGRDKDLEEATYTGKSSDGKGEVVGKNDKVGLKSKGEKGRESGKGRGEDSIPHSNKYVKKATGPSHGQQPKLKEKPSLQGKGTSEKGGGVGSLFN
ncbi:unnamed protein product [Linum tenue]|uniref:DUF4283 domain-containing protein n=1 Tax=Linum tenue TaxID=586396 RepID=A0AAV0J9M3_9ROSI|nr:unnamed protein product [Linum tenue]